MSAQILECNNFLFYIKNLNCFPSCPCPWAVPTQGFLLMDSPMPSVGRNIFSLLKEKHPGLHCTGQCCREAHLVPTAYYRYPKPSAFGAKTLINFMLESSLLLHLWKGEKSFQRTIWDSASHGKFKTFFPGECFPGVFWSVSVHIRQQSFLQQCKFGAVPLRWISDTSSMFFS